MARVPVKVTRRISACLKRFQSILELARERDSNESDTVVIVTDILDEMLGYDKYNEVTSEYAIRNTYCDLAIKINGKIQYLIEVKAIGADLNENHIKQAVDYAANAGVDWVILTNGIRWIVSRVLFTKPISREQVVELNLLELNHRREADIQNLFLLCREAIKRSTLTSYHEQVQAINRFFLGAVILTDPVIKTICREVRRIGSKKVSVDPKKVREILREEVLKREITYGERAAAAAKKARKAQSQALRRKTKRTAEPDAKNSLPS